MHMWPCMHPKGTYKAFLCTQTPHDACGSPSQFFYSIETGPVHSIFLSNYHDYTTGSDQARRRIPQPSRKCGHARWLLVQWLLLDTHALAVDSAYGLLIVANYRLWNQSQISRNLCTLSPL